MISMSRKTLEDHWLKLRKGLYYKFDFREHKDLKMGDLSRFLKGLQKVPHEELKKLDKPSTFVELRKQLFGVPTTCTVNEDKLFEVISQ
jgi:hypothetical protein